MHLGLRLFFGFFVLAGLAALVLLHVVLSEVKPSVREVMEDLLVDSAHVLAETAAPALARMPPGGTLQGTEFGDAVAAYARRPVAARIWGIDKRSLDLRVYVTDAQGRVVFDNGPRPEVGADYSRWRDVARTLRGEYGARFTQGPGGTDADAVMHVAAPVIGRDGVRLGVLGVAKPMATVQQFVDRAERKILRAGLVLFAVSTLIGLGVTAWAVHSVRQLRRYAQQAQAGAAPAAPALPGELGELARAMGQMRERLDNRQAIEQAMRALTHELKSPLTAIRGAAELLQEAPPGGAEARPLAEADRQRFVAQIGEQAERARVLVDRQLELSKLESLRGLDRPAEVDLATLARSTAHAWRPTFEQRGLTLALDVPAAAPLRGDEAQLRLAISNLLANAADFAPEDSAIDLRVAPHGRHWRLELRDRGPGVPDFAWPQLGTRFFSTPRPRDGRKGSGLGLAIVRRVAELHGGELRLEPAAPGLRATLQLPAN